MKPIRIKTIDGLLQRYPTCGDYIDRGDHVEILITKQGNHDYEFLIAIHELVEWWITKKRGILEEDITDYDIEWECRPDPKADEPGNEHDSIYKKEHRFAENIERQVAHEIGIDWDSYNNSLKI